MLTLLLSFALAIAPPATPEAELQRIARDFAFSLGADDMTAFEPLATGEEPPAKSEQWHDVRVVVERSDCRTVTGVRSTIIQAGEREAVVLVAVEGSARIPANGKIVPFRTPWTLRLRHDAAGWHIRSVAWTVQELWWAFAAGDREWDAMRWAEGFVTPSDYAYKLADYGSDGHLLDARGERAIDYAEIIARENHDEARLAFCDFARARRKWSTKEFERGHELARRAVERARPAGDPDILGAALFGLALNEIRNHPVEALAHFREAYDLYPRLSNPRLAMASLINISLIYSGQHDYRAMMKASKDGLEMVRTSPWPDGEAAFLKDLADAHAYLHDYAVARQLAERALAAARIDRDPMTLTTTLSFLGSIEYELGDVPSGDRHFRELMQFIQSTPTWEACSARGTWGEMLFAHHRDAEAEQVLRETVEQAHRDQEGSCASAALAALSELRVRQGRYTEAAQFARQALGETLEKDLDNQPQSVQWRARVALGRALAHGGRTDEGIASLRAALDDIESERGDVVEVAQTSFRFMDDKVAAYHALIDVLLSAKRTGEAFAVAERMRGRTLIVSLDRKATTLDYAPEERAREQQLEKRLGEINRSILAARASGDSTRITPLRRELAAARLDLDRFDEESGFIHASARAHEAITDMGELALPKAMAGTALVEYVVMEHSTVAFTLRGTHVTARRLPVGRAALARKVESFCARIESRDLAYAGAAKQLYHLLLAPLGPDLGDASTLAIVPDLELWRMPFQALVAPDGRFVIERANVFYTPSLAMFLKARAARGLAPHKATLLAFGNPVVNGAAEAKLRDIGYDGIIRPLPDAEREVRSIAALYGAGSRVFIGAEASEHAFKQEAPRYDIIHLATHGFLDDESPMYSALLFAAAPDKPAEDGLLETREILRLRLHARTAVLAACDTGRGATRAGEGVIGISWAFLMAGCPTTVVTQWKASSAAAASLMIDFHRHLRRGAGNAEALRAAQRSMLRERTLRHPFYWASFVVVGAP